MATLMEVHALGAPLERGLERGFCCSTMSLYPTRGQWLPVVYRGRIMKTSFFPPSAHLSGGHGFKHWDQQKLFRHKIQLLAWRDDTHAHADFPISFPSHTTCSLLPRIFLLPLESLSKLLTPRWMTTDFPIFLIYPSTHKPIWVIPS